MKSERSNVGCLSLLITLGVVLALGCFAAAVDFKDGTFAIAGAIIVAALVYVVMEVWRAAA